MVQVTVSVDTNGLSSSFAKFPEAKALGLKYAAEEMVRVLQMNSPVDHGLLKSWFPASLDENEAHIQTPADYAGWVNDGTGIYGPRGDYIYPHGKALHWNGPNGEVFAKYSRGQPGQHFVEKSIDDVEGRLAGYFLKALEEVMG